MKKCLVSPNTATPPPPLSPNLTVAPWSLLCQLCHHENGLDASITTTEEHTQDSITSSACASVSSVPRENKTQPTTQTQGRFDSYLTVEKPPWFSLLRNSIFSPKAKCFFFRCVANNRHLLLLRRKIISQRNKSRSIVDHHFGLASKLV